MTVLIPVCGQSLVGGVHWGLCPPDCRPQVALVVLDSATFHFRQDFTDAAQRSRLMLSMAQQLAQLAEQRGVAVVMVNQVSHRAAQPIQYQLAAFTAQYTPVTPTTFPSQSAFHMHACLPAG